MMKTALIAGAGGAASKRLIETLLADPGWSVLALARTPRASSGRLAWVSADLFDAPACRHALADHRDITHVFYTSRAKHGETGVESIPDNVAMLANVLDAVEPVAARLEHVHIVEGTKWYGMHLGPFPTPAPEDADVGHLPDNFYYAQERMLAARQRGKDWAWSASRPTFIYDFAPERARNGVAVLGAYAALCGELSLPFDFPGSQAAFDARRDFTDAALLAREIAYIATATACRNAAFNTTNGDVKRWRDMWPALAAYLRVTPGDARPFSMYDWVRDKQPVWQRIVRRHGLADTRLDQVADWAFADFHFGHGYDIVSSPAKLQAAGFRETLDSERMLLDHLARYREARIFP
jgi:nucleoside-diphosphate-sugar epimerase